jgi:putative ABC transport system permease protein
MFQNYLKTALRNLLRNPVYSFINVSGLSLGLACAMLIILYLKDEVSYDRFQANANHIYRVFSQATMSGGPEGTQTERMGITGYFQGPHFAAKIPEIKSFVRVQSGAEDMKTGTEVKYQAVQFVDSNFFSVFSFPMLSGNPKTCLLQPDAMVISEDMAKKQFGNSDPMGKIILLKSGGKFVPHTVTGVTRRCPQNSSIKFDILMPVNEPADWEQNNQNWFNFFLNTYVLLNPQADVQKVEGEMTKVYKQDAAAIIKGFEEQFKMKDPTLYKLEPFLAIHLNKEVSRDDIVGASDPMYSYILSGIVFFILLIACINFVNLSVARSIKRGKEVGIRKVVGGNRKQLITQFLGESFILCLIAFVLAVLIVETLLPLFNRLSNKELAISYLFDAKLVAGYFALFLITGLLAGFYPALVLSKYDPVKTLYGRIKLSGKNYLQKSLVVLQFTLASFLILATFTTYFQFHYLTTENLGYDDSNLVLVNKLDMNPGESRLLKQELMKSPVILGVAPKDNGFAFNGGKINGDKGIGFANVTIDESYLPLLKIPIVQGRNFSADHPSDSSRSIIVNEAFVKEAGWKNPIGQLLSYNDQKYQVVGEVKDYHFRSLNYKIESEVFFMGTQSNNYGMLYIKIKPNSESASLSYIEKTFKSLFPLNPYSYEFKNDENLKNYEAEARWKKIMLFGAILTIFISCIGLFGLSVLSAEKRTKEIGIRKVLGASVNNIVTILSTDFLKLVIFSLVIAIPISWFASKKWLDNYPYRITLSWWMFAIVCGLVVVIALTTVCFQAIRAAMANPAKSLRTE